MLLNYIILHKNTHQDGIRIVKEDNSSSTFNRVHLSQLRRKNVMEQFNPMPVVAQEQSLIPLLVAGGVVAATMWWNNGKQQEIVDAKIAASEGRIMGQIQQLGQQLSTTHNSPPAWADKVFSEVRQEVKASNEATATMLNSKLEAFMNQFDIKAVA